jgi:hypothetical protein
VTMMSTIVWCVTPCSLTTRCHIPEERRLWRVCGYWTGLDSMSIFRRRQFPFMLPRVLRRQLKLLGVRMTHVECWCNNETGIDLRPLRPTGQQGQMLLHRQLHPTCWPEAAHRLTDLGPRGSLEATLVGGGGDVGAGGRKEKNQNCPCT